MPYFASGYSSMTAPASKCAVECRSACSASPVDSWSPYSAIGCSSVYGRLVEDPLSPPARDAQRRGVALNIDWLALVDAIGYPAAGLGILIESAGVPFPGETLLLAAAAWAAARNHSLVLVILFGFLGATAGA